MMTSDSGSTTSLSFLLTEQKVAQALMRLLPPKAFALFGTLDKLFKLTYTTAHPTRKTAAAQIMQSRGTLRYCLNLGFRSEFDEEQADADPEYERYLSNAHVAAYREKHAAQRPDIASASPNHLRMQIFEELVKLDGIACAAVRHGSVMCLKLVTQMLAELTPGQKLPPVDWRFTERMTGQAIQKSDLKCSSNLPNKVCWLMRWTVLRWT